MSSSVDSIRAVDKETVHRICSGQVVLTLSTAVKELVENSLDAGAKNIDIQLGDSGAALVQVADDGAGITEANFKALTLKHHTSKLSDFDDLTALSTFGFRGEALSSLCALSKLSVTTRHGSAQTATALSYGRGGEVNSTEPAARAVGTTVLLEELFAPLPVRRREFIRNVKREFGKLLHVLQAYCLVSAGVRLSCWNDTGKGKRQVLATRGAKGLKEAIVDVFGRKQMQSLVEIQFCEAMEEDLLMYNLSEGCADANLRISGYISSCVHGQGRSSGDRQFYFINQRPCDPSKLSKLVNEIYRSNNRQQTPFVCLLVNTAADSVDVNVTPDKRQIMLEQEKQLLAIVRASLRKTFEKMPATYEVNRSWIKDKRPPEEENVLPSSPVGIPALQALRNSFSVTSSGDSQPNIKVSAPAPKKSKKNFPVQSQLSFSVLKDLKANSTSSSVTETESESPTVEISEEDSSVDLMLSEPQSVDEPCEAPVVVVDLEDRKRTHRKEIRLPVSLNWLKRRQMDRQANNKSENKSAHYRKFLSKISPTDNESAEAELVKHFSKNLFPEMRLIGQFNLGFIVAQIHSDLFIIDQHASDEKFNFERLQQAQLLEGQNMVVPQQLELSAANEDMIKEHLEVFHRNGFQFDFSEGVKLKRIPHYRNWLFGKDDVEELLFMLSESLDSTTNHLRPSRVRAMFASRACRTSIMVGTALSKADMRRIVDHMAEMEQPWNCPHGRPTMRHLVNLNMIAK